MKILLATYWHVPHLGGVWSYMEQLKERLEFLGHEVDLLGYGDEEGTFVHIVNKNKKLYSNKVLPLLHAMLNKSAYPEIHINHLVKYTEFRRYVYELSVAYLGLHSYDVIHTQDVLSTASINRIRPQKTAQVATLHGCVAHEIRLQLKTIHKSPTSQIAREYYDQLEHLGATSAERTIVANQWLKRTLTDEFQVPKKKLDVLHYGFDTAAFLEKMDRESKVLRPKDKKVIIFSGRLVELKGVQDLIEALHQLKKKRTDWECWIVGEGDKMTELRFQAKYLKLSNDIVFMGKRDDVPGLLKQADIYVIPSIIENQPLSLIEAQLAGKAIIASDVGGLPEMVKHNATGLLIPPKNPTELSKMLEKLLKDNSLRKRLGSQARLWAMSHWSLDKMTDMVMNVYHSAIAERSSHTYEPAQPLGTI
ncbi:glycosyltransferase family 4 protein [Paenibacillus jiagnxiensis]|uniref:glycosyltransferase family 4 protein n=1 Tax=Paenibacillus jiagnxiensis TaxID=3228926 RepID=UPI0033BC4584